MNQNASLPDAATAVPAYTIETWPVERLKAYERNARKHSPAQVRQLRDSFQKFGQVWPILVRADGTIIAGHGRLEAAKTLGLTEVRVIVAVGWSEEQCRAFGILDNKVALNSTWDEALLGAPNWRSWRASVSTSGCSASIRRRSKTSSRPVLRA